jgi:hypothetical protein
MARAATAEENESLGTDEVNAFVAIFGEIEGFQNLTTADASNIWKIIAGIAGVIPKVLFSSLLKSPVWAEVAAAVIGAEVVEKILEAIPILGEVLGVIAIVGDVATLAEAVAETATSPWVIANQISLTYSATVTVKHDPNVATWPREARCWRIESKIEGTTALNPITGQINEGGHIQSDDLVLQNLTVPFGGATITWSIVVLDAQGNQVGTGAIQLPNNDSNNPSTAVTFAITELPEPITAATVFRRDDTVLFSTAVGGYTWSDAVPDTGTIANSGVQEVTGVAIATTLGVAGLVWKQNDKYWLRGVPVAENGTTITLGHATRQGFARRPFLLFDSFVGPGDRANHVLLEPDDTSPGYHIRSLNINPTTRRPDLGPHHLTRLLHPPGQRGGPAFLRLGGGHPHRHRPGGPPAAGQHRPASAGSLHGRGRHPDRPALVPDGRGDHPSRHRHRAGSRHSPAGRLRPQRQSCPLLRHLVTRGLHAPVPHARHLPGCRCRRLRPDLHPLLWHRRPPAL